MLDMWRTLRAVVPVVREEFWAMVDRITVRLVTIPEDVWDRAQVEDEYTYARYVIDHADKEPLAPHLVCTGLSAMHRPLSSTHCVCGARLDNQDDVKPDETWTFWCDVAERKLYAKP